MDDGRSQERFWYYRTVPNDLPITVDQETMSGVPVFAGTRVPVAAMLDNLVAGVSLDEFLDNFPTVRREQAVKVLQHFKKSLNDINRSA